MYLLAVHIHNLKLIHSTEGQQLHLSKFEDETGTPHFEPYKIVEELLKLHLIETEQEDDVYFLTPEGYDWAENHTDKEESQGDNDMFAGTVLSKILEMEPKKLRKNLFAWLLWIGVVVTAYVALKPDSQEGENNRLNTVLDSAQILEAAQIKLKQRLDSIAAEQTLDSTNTFKNHSNSL